MIKERMGQVQDVLIVDTNDRKAEMDGMTNFITTIDSPHHHLHDGDMYGLGLNGEEGVGSAIEIALRPPDNTKRFHIIFNFSSEAKANFRMMEAVDGLTGGIDHVPLNRERNSSHTSDALVAKTGYNGDPLSYGSAGITLAEYHFGSNKAGALAGGAKESPLWIIKNNVDTVFRLESEATNNELSLEVAWYEHIDSNLMV